MSTHTLRTTAVMVGLIALVLPLAASAQPTVTWNTYLGGSAADGSATNDKPQGVLTDRYGRTFVTGGTDATRFPGSTSQPSVPSGQDAFLTYFNAEGRVAKTYLFGGASHDVGRRLAFNPSAEDHLYIVGTTASSTIRDGVPVYGSLQGETDAFLARMDWSGSELSLTWFMYLGGSGKDEGNDVAVYRKDNLLVVYVVGKNADEAFVARVDIDSANKQPSLPWGITTFGSPGVIDEAFAVATAPNNHQVYVGGVVRGPVSPSNKLPTPLNGFSTGEDGFFAELNPADGTVKWFEYLGGGSDDDVRDILHQPTSGAIIIIGNTNSSNFPPKDTHSGKGVFLLRVNRDTTQGAIGGISAQLRIGEGGESMEGHGAVDARDNVYVGGTTTTSRLSHNAFDPGFDPGTSKSDGFVAMVGFELNGLVWTSYVGGPTDTPEAVMGLSAVPVGQLTFVGHSTAQKNLLVVDTGDDPSANGGEDGFVFRVEVDPEAVPRPEAPLGWSCSSVSSGGPLSLLTLALLALRRARRRSAR